jgi:hypothetical protein
MYKWTDEAGQTVYSQTPPPGGNAVRIQAPPAPDPAEVERRRQELQRGIERSFDQAVEREASGAEHRGEERAGATRAANCEAARRNLETLQNLGKRRVRTPDGEYLVLSEDDREQQMREARDQISKFCD